MANGVAADERASASRALAWLVVLLFFIWGGATSLNDVLIPKLKGLYSLSYAEVMLTQFAFFIAYFIVSIPAGALIARIGYLRGIVVGLVVTAVGAAAVLAGGARRACMRPSSSRCSCWRAASPSCRSPPTRSSRCSATRRASISRLTFAQAFNSLGTTIWPYIGSDLILAGAASKTDPATLSGDRARRLPRQRKRDRRARLCRHRGRAGADRARSSGAQRNAVRNERPAAVGFARQLRAARNRARRLRRRRAVRLCRRRGVDRQRCWSIISSCRRTIGARRRRPRASICRSTGAARWSAASSAPALLQRVSSRAGCSRVFAAHARRCSCWPRWRPAARSPAGR